MHEAIIVGLQCTKLFRLTSIRPSNIYSFYFSLHLTKHATSLDFTITKVFYFTKPVHLLPTAYIFASPPKVSPKGKLSKYFYPKKFACNEHFV